MYAKDIDDNLVACIWEKVLQVLYSHVCHPQIVCAGAPGVQTMMFQLKAAGNNVNVNEVL